MAVVNTPCTMLFNGEALTPTKVSSNVFLPIGSNRRQDVNFYFTAANFASATTTVSIQFAFNPSQDAQWQTLNDVTGNPISVIGGGNETPSNNFMFTCSTPMGVYIRAVCTDTSDTPVNLTNAHVGFC